MAATTRLLRGIEGARTVREGVDGGGMGSAQGDSIRLGRRESAGRNTRRACACVVVLSCCCYACPPPQSYFIYC